MTTLEDMQRLATENQTELEEFNKALLANGIPTEELPNDVTRLRFLIAREYNVEAATKLYLNWQKWYKGLYGKIDVNSIRTSIEAKKSFIFGEDKLRRPTLYARSERHDPKIPLQETENHLAWQLFEICDRCEQDGRPHQFSVIFDMSLLGYSNLDSAADKIMMHMLENYFPERLGVVYIVNASVIFWLMWKILSPFIPARTKAKVKIFTSAAKEELLSNWDSNQLLNYVGGTAGDYEPDYSHLFNKQ